MENPIPVRYLLEDPKPSDTEPPRDTVFVPNDTSVSVPSGCLELMRPLDL